jgi:hypothetical protein
VRSWLDVPTFATRRLHACHHARAPSGGRWICGREMCGKFCLNADFHVTFRYILHAVKLRHGTDGFYFPSEGRRAKDFFYPKNPTPLAGCEPSNLGTRGQHAASSPSKPLTRLKEHFLSAVTHCLFQHIRNCSARVLHPHPEEAACLDDKALFLEQNILRNCVKIQ